MNSNEFFRLCIQPDLSLDHALLRMEECRQGILLVINNNGVLLRTLTDGDLRRAVLNKKSADTPVSDLPFQAPITVTEDAGIDAIRNLMEKHRIDHVPVVDIGGKVVDVVFLRELAVRTYLSSPHLGLEETVFVDDAFKTNWVAPLGPHVDGFEKELAAHVGVKDAAAVSSGTAAIHLGLLLLGVKPGSTVFCSSLTFVGSCNPILYCGARPVFIDSEPSTWNMSPAALEHAFEWAKRENRLPACVILVNLYGQSADMDALLPICERYGVPVLEDAAESLGAEYKGRASGGFGRVAVYSFNGNKIITTSGGGMLVADDPDLVARARKLSTQAREPAAHYEHLEVGFNYRMSNVLAGIGRGQLRVLKQRVAQRRRVFERYQHALADFTDLQWMPEPAGYRSTRWLTCFTLAGDDAARRSSQVMSALDRHLIEARPVWKPMHLQPLFNGAPYFGHEHNVDISAGLFRSGICLPSGSNLLEQQQDRVIDHLRHVLGAVSNR
ncbi:MAG: DegT/DnrJ/EryC1/StrS family aminotransferase [Pseudomonadota bacterium]